MVEAASRGGESGDGSGGGSGGGVCHDARGGWMSKTDKTTCMSRIQIRLSLSRQISCQLTPLRAETFELEIDAADDTRDELAWCNCDDEDPVEAAAAGAGSELEKSNPASNPANRFSFARCALICLRPPSMACWHQPLTTESGSWP